MVHFCLVNSIDGTVQSPEAVGDFTLLLLSPRQKRLFNMKLLQMPAFIPFTLRSMTKYYKSINANLDSYARSQLQALEFKIASLFL